MGVFGITSNVLTVYKADVSGHKQAVKELSGEQKKAAKAQLDSLEAQNAKLQQHINTVGKAALVVGTLGAAYVAGKASMEAYFSRAKLESAAAGADLERLRAASGGLKTDTELLTFAAASLNTTRKLSNEQMEAALQAGRALVKQGNDEAKVFEALKKAIVEGSVEPLKEFGVVVAGASGEQEKFNQLIEVTGELARSTGGDFEMVGDSVERLGTRAQNVWENLKIGIGEVVFKVLDLGNSLEELMYFEENARRNAMLMKARLDWKAARDELDEQYAELEQLNYRMRVLSTSALSTEERNRAYKGTKFEMEGFKWVGAGANQKLVPIKGAGGGGGGRSSSAEDVGESDYTYASSLEGLGRLRSLESGASIRTVNVPGGLSTQIEQLAALRDRALRADMAPSVDGEENDFLSQMFGPPSRFEEMQRAFELVSGAASSSFDAWISGASSAKEALQDLAGSVIGGWAKMMFAQGWKDVGAGWSAAANPVTAWEAPGYFVAAAKNFAGAAALGLIAREMGGSGAPGGGGAGASGGAGAGTAYVAPADSGGRSDNYYFGDDWARKSPRERAAEARDILDTGRRQGDGSTIVSH